MALLVQIAEIVANSNPSRRRLVSKEWIDEMTRTQAISPTRDGDGTFFGYGYYWWMVPKLGEGSARTSRTLRSSASGVRGF